MRKQRSERPVSHGKRGQVAEPQAKLTNQLLFGAAAALTVAVAVVVGERWESIFPDRRGPVIDVYWTHECPCAFEFIESLKAGGMHVRSFEAETLQFKRQSLRIPDQLHGCHIGSYLGYFVEGHVPPAAIRQLAKQKPPGLGLALIEPPPSASPDPDPTHGNVGEVRFFKSAQESTLWQTDAVSPTP